MYCVIEWPDQVSESYFLRDITHMYDFLRDLIGNMDSENMKIVDRARERAQEQSLMVYRDSDQAIEECVEKKKRVTESLVNLQSSIRQKRHVGL